MVVSAMRGVRFSRSGRIFPNSSRDSSQGGADGSRMRGGRMPRADHSRLTSPTRRYLRTMLIGSAPTSMRHSSSSWGVICDRAVTPRMCSQVRNALKALKTVRMVAMAGRSPPPEPRTVPGLGWLINCQM